MAHGLVLALRITTATAPVIMLANNMGAPMNNCISPQRQSSSPHGVLPPWPVAKNTTSVVVNADVSTARPLPIFFAKLLVKVPSSVIDPESGACISRVRG